MISGKSHKNRDGNFYLRFFVICYKMSGYFHRFIIQYGYVIFNAEGFNAKVFNAKGFIK